MGSRVSARKRAKLLIAAVAALALVSAGAPAGRTLCHWATRRGLLDWHPDDFPGPDSRAPRDRRGADARSARVRMLLPSSEATKVCLFGAVLR